MDNPFAAKLVLQVNAIKGVDNDIMFDPKSQRSMDDAYHQQTEDGKRMTLNSEQFFNKLSSFDITDHNQLCPFTQESKTSFKRVKEDLMLKKIESSNDELVEVNMLKSSARLT